MIRNRKYTKTIAQQFIKMYDGVRDGAVGSLNSVGNWTDDIVQEMEQLVDSFAG